MKNLGLRRPEDYEQLLKRSQTEWNELVESVIVTETWFFRDAAVFAALVRLAREEWLPAHPRMPMRLLSIPCASGEEPYSLVMALLDAGVPPARFHIDAVDISARALARAARGVYGKNSFRGTDLTFRDRYFQPCHGGFLLHSSVRDCVHFHRSNLFSDDFLFGQHRYDFIFCRNLLIYFDRPTQRKALERIGRLLSPSGIIFVGPVEQPFVLNHGFVSADLPKASACRKAAPGLRRQRPIRSSHPPAHLAASPPRGASELQPAASHRLPPPAVANRSPASPPDLEIARRLADAGGLNEAAEICEAHLRQSKVSAQAYYLLGLVREARGDPGALDCYRKALYLEPDHYESLLQMALLSQKNGDPARARALRTRAQRIKTTA